ncbi:MAG: hypothetical protein ACK5AZ_08700 [Bryobacteraceae bacterium]
MGVLISINRQKAILRQGQWVCADVRVEEALNEATECWIRETGGPPLNSKDPEHSVAVEIARRFGGKILFRAVPRGKGSRRIYMARRQLKLDFGA